MKGVGVDMRAVVVLFIMSLFAVGYVASWFVPVPQQNHDTIEEFHGALLTGFAAAWGYYLGTSKSSTEKDSTISKLSEGTGDGKDQLEEKNT